MKPTRRCSIITILLLTALLTSVALNWFLYNRGKQYYLQLNQTRLDPTGLNYYPSPQITLSNPDKTTVVFFGDSRAAAWPPPNLAGFEFINRGVGAQTSAQVLQRFDHHVKPLNPQVIVVQVCINDLKTIPLFPEQKENIIDTCKRNVGEIVTRATGMGAAVILTTIFPPGKVPPERQPFWSANVDVAIEEVNTYIHSLSAPKVVIFDAYALLAENGIAREETMQDFLHLNAAGYRVLNGELAHILTTLEQSP